VQVVEVDRPVLVDDRGAAVLAGLPDAEGGAGRVGEDSHPTEAGKVEGLHEDAATGGPYFGSDLVGVVHPHVGVPRRDRRGTLGRHADGRHVPATDASHVVRALRVRRHDVLDRPPEQAGGEHHG